MTTNANLLGTRSSIGGKVLGHYEVHEKIGEGGLAIVYKALDTRLERWVALKALQPWAMVHAGFRRQLLQEARAASALSHPNIVTIHAVLEENDACFIVMEYVVGKTLDSVVPARGFAFREALPYAAQMVEALCAAENAGIVHGDLKPQNIMLTDTGQIKLLDFGLARARVGLSPKESHSVTAQFGTKAYMAPERIRRPNAAPTIHADIFSVGVILYALLTGRNPFPEKAATPTRSRTSEPLDFPTKVPPLLANVVRRCLEKSPNRRFSSMRYLLTALKKCDPTPAAVESNRASKRIGAVSKPLTQRATVERKVRRTLEQIGYYNITGSRQGLAELKTILERRPSAAIRQTISLSLRSLILKGADFAGEVPGAVRNLRKMALSVLIQSARGDLASCFKDIELEHLDLYEMDFTGSLLSGLSFRFCFLAGANFTRCDLTNASFAGAWIRNARFAQADLVGADLTDADWFNALGLTEAQLRSARPGTLLSCPANVAAMHRYLQARYGFPFDSWPSRHQQELKDAWRDVLRPGGLGEVFKNEKNSGGI